MTFWPLLGLIIVTGAIGGILYSIINEGGFQLPGIVEKNGTRVLVLGFVGDIIIGAVTAGISWALYGLASIQIQGTVTTLGTVLALFGGLFTGLAGSGWFSSATGRSALQLGLAKAASSGEETEGVGKEMDGGVGATLPAEGA